MPELADDAQKVAVGMPAFQLLPVIATAIIVYAAYLTLEGQT